MFTSGGRPWLKNVACLSSLLYILVHLVIACEQALRGSLMAGREKEQIQLRLCNLNSTPNSPVAPHRLNCQIFANQRQAETNVKCKEALKHTRRGYDIVTNVISANQHFVSQKSMQIFKSQSRSCNVSFSRPVARLPRRACSEAKLVTKYPVMIWNFMWRNDRQILVNPFYMSKSHFFVKSVTI